MCTLRVAIVAAILCLKGAAAVIPHLHVTFGVVSGYYKVPMTKMEVVKDKNSKYVFVEHDKDLNVDLYSYPGDPRFFILFAKNGRIAGVRTGYIKEDLPKRADSNGLELPYHFENKPFYKSGNYWNTPLWYATALFVNPEKLKSGEGPGPKDDDFELYLPLEGEWTLIPKDQCKAEALGFVEQACFPQMGLHYFYKMSKDSNCEDLVGVFTLYEMGELIGMGIIPFGTYTSKDRTWFEDPSGIVSMIIGPNGPLCVLDWMTDYGSSSMHFFFKRQPRLTVCTWPFQKRNQCPK